MLALQLVQLATQSQPLGQPGKHAGMYSTQTARARFRPAMPALEAVGHASSKTAVYPQTYILRPPQREFRISAARVPAVVATRAPVPAAATSPFWR